MLAPVKNLSSRNLPAANLASGSLRSVVHPCIFEGKPTLFYEKGLQNANPVLFQRHGLRLLFDILS